MRNIITIIISIVCLLGVTNSLEAQNKTVGHLYFSHAFYFTNIADGENSLGFCQSIGYRFNDISVFCPMTIAERFCSEPQIRDYDFHGLIGCGVSKDFRISTDSIIEMGLSGQSTVTRSVYKFALGRLEAKYLSRNVRWAYSLGAGIESYKHYGSSPGTDGLRPVLSIGFVF